MAKKITKKLVDAINPTDNDEVIWDAEIRGFGLRCRKNGGKYYVLKYRARGRQRGFTIGRHGSPWTPETARREARKLLGEVAARNDPSAAKAKAKRGATVSDVIDRFMTEHIEVKTKDRTKEEYLRLLNKIIIPELGKVKIKDVTRSDVDRLHYKFRNTRYQANRILAVLSKLFNLAERWGYRPDGTNPCLHVEKFKEEKRERFLGELEFQRLGRILSKAETEWTNYKKYVAAIRLLIFTGCRLNEILTLRWDDVDLDKGEIRLQESKTGSKIIHLNLEALELLENLPHLPGNIYVIPGEKTGKHLINLQKPWRKIRKEACLEDVRLHDLRHTFASVGASSGLGLPQIGALLGHTNASTTQRYAHLASGPLKEANNMIGNYLKKALKTAD